MKAANDAAVARLESLWDASRVHQPNEVPGNPLTPYAVVSVSAPGADNIRNDGSTGSEPYRIVVQAMGKTTNAVADAAQMTRDAFLGHHLALPGYDTTPGLPELAPQTPYRDPAGGTLLTLTLTYTFHAYPTA